MTMEWKECTLGDVLNFRRGHDLPHSRMAEGNIPVAGSNGIIGFHNEATPIAPILTIGRSGNVGTPYFYESAWAHNTTLYVDDFKGNNPLFLYYLCKTMPFSNMGGGSAVPTLNRNHIHPLPVKIPVKNSDQRRIAAILSSLDRKIELNNKINAQLEEMAQAIFKNWFVDFEPFKDGKFVDSELGRIPEGWRVGTLGEIATYSKNSVNPGKSPDKIFSHYSLPAFDERRFPISQSGSEIMSNKFIFDSKTTLISKLNPHIKRVWFVDEVFENSICSTEFIPVKANDESCAAFVHCCMNSDFFYSKAIAGVNGATTSHQRIHPEDLMNIKLAINEEKISDFSKIAYPMLTQLLPFETVSVAVTAC